MYMEQLFWLPLNVPKRLVANFMFAHLSVGNHVIYHLISHLFRMYTSFLGPYIKASILR